MSIQSLNDKELVQLYVNGNEDCLSVLLHRHKAKIFSSIILVIKDRSLAEDIFQDTFYKVIQTLKRGQYNEEGKFPQWVMRIARNLIIDYFRILKKMPPMPVYINSEGDEVCVFNNLLIENHSRSAEEKHVLKDKIRNLINQLDADQREVVLLRTYYDMSFKEIAEFTNVSINTALGRMRYALINLKRMIEDQKVEVLL